MAKDLHGFLLEWAVNFIKNKDAVHKKIEQIENGKDGFDLYVKYKDKEQYFMLIPKISDVGNITDYISGKINAITQSDGVYFSIVTLNSKDNFDALLKNWRRLIYSKRLSIIFANPLSETDKKWSISPYTHNKICDDSSLESGLKSIFETVEEIDEQQMIAMLNGHNVYDHC